MKYAIMVRTGIFTFMLFSCLATTGYAQTITESWLRQAGISCGGGLSVELQGEIDAAVFSRLRIAGIEGDGSFQKSETETLLNQFKEEEKRETYKDYLNCLVRIMEMATTNSQLPPEEVVLDSPVAVAQLETVKRGQRFVMTLGDAVAIKDHSQILTVQRVEKSRSYGTLSVYYTWSNSETGESENDRVAQAELINFGEGCTVTPYKIDIINEQVSLISNC